MSLLSGLKTAITGRKMPQTPYFWEYYNRCRHAVDRVNGIGSAPSVLDVGGATGQLLKKFGLTDVTIVDYLKGAHVKGDGKCLPFRDAAYDAVTAIDVFEHIPKNDRTAVLDEMLRVSRKMVIVIAPQSTDLNVMAEKLVMKYEQQEWLVEHAEKGLVDFGELEMHLQRKKLTYEITEIDNLMNWVVMSLAHVKNISDVYQEAYPFEDKAAFRRKVLVVKSKNSR